MRVNNSHAYHIHHSFTFITTTQPPFHFTPGQNTNGNTEVAHRKWEPLHITARTHTHNHTLSPNHHSSLYYTTNRILPKKGKQKQEAGPLQQNQSERKRLSPVSFEWESENPLAIFAHIVNYYKQKHVAQNLLRIFSPQQH